MSWRSEEGAPPLSLAGRLPADLAAPKRSAQRRSSERRHGWPAEPGRRPDLDRSGARSYTPARTARAALLRTADGPGSPRADDLMCSDSSSSAWVNKWCPTRTRGRLSLSTASNWSLRARVAGCALVFVQPGPEVRRVEADVVSEAVVGYASFTRLPQQPRVRDAEQPARSLGVEERSKGARLIQMGRPSTGVEIRSIHESRSMRCAVGGCLVSVSQRNGTGRSPSRALVSRNRARPAACPSCAAYWSAWCSRARQ